MKTEWTNVTDIDQIEKLLDDYMLNKIDIHYLEISQKGNELWNNKTVGKGGHIIEYVEILSKVTNYESNDKNYSLSFKYKKLYIGSVRLDGIDHIEYDYYTKIEDNSIKKIAKINSIYNNENNQTS